MSLQDQNDPILAKIHPKLPNSIRLITFNINGYRTLFHYHPWNIVRTLSSMFNLLKGDIITLQELKVASRDIDNSLGKLDGFYSFLTVPSQKKGYSGVGVYVRIPKDDEPKCVKDSLKVVKAEEGITGVLVSHDTGLPYIKSDGGIGGYVEDLNHELAEKIDGEGRCVILEFANNTVIISTYCPANSMATDEGEEFRVNFFKLLFARIKNLEAMGKHVVLMGDINISRDLIDSAERLEALFMAKTIKEANVEQFDIVNREQAIAFIKGSKPKTMLNELLIDSIYQEENGNKRILIDTVRKIQGRKRALYTVWNTIKNSRPGNFGSRIDLILATKDLADLCKNADIWPFLMGSDHCPVFSDFDVRSLKAQNITAWKMPRLEAKYVYKLTTGDIGMMFSMAKKRSASSAASPAKASISSAEEPNKLHKSEPVKKTPLNNNKSQNSISEFFKSTKRTEPGQEDEEPIPVKILEESKSMKNGQPTTTEPEPEGSKITVSNGRFLIESEKIPSCKHSEPCILKTSRKETTRGKKFWTCAKSAGSISNSEDQSKYNCGFFKWK